MDSIEMETRVAALETRNRALAAALAGLLALAGLAAFGPQSEAPPEASEPRAVVRAERIELVDPEGRVRAELGIDAEGSAGLFLRDGEGRLRGCVIHDEQQSALYLMDEHETIRVGAAQFAHGGGGFALHGPESKGAAVLYLKGEGSLSFYDEAGGVLAKLPSEQSR